MTNYKKQPKRVDFFCAYFLDKTMYTLYSIDKRSAYATDKNGCGYSPIIVGFLPSLPTAPIQFCRVGWEFFMPSFTNLT